MLRRANYTYLIPSQWIRASCPSIPFQWIRVLCPHMNNMQALESWDIYFQLSTYLHFMYESVFKAVIYRSLFVVPCGLPREMEIYWLACRAERPECCGSSIVSRENGCKAPTDLDGTHGAWWVHSSQIWVDLGDIWVVYIRLWICWSAYRCKQYMNHQMMFRQLNHQQFDACIGCR